jgi:hypothetical protein
MNLSSAFTAITNAMLYAAVALAIVDVLVLMYYIIRITCAMLMSCAFTN